MKKTTIENAIVRSTTLGVEDHGIFTAFLHLEGDGWGCSFGGYSLDTWDETKKRRVGTDFGTEFLLRVMATLEVNSWEELSGAKLRCKTEGLGGGVTAIGHLIKNKWFDPKELRREMGLRE